PLGVEIIHGAVRLGGEDFLRHRVHDEPQTPFVLLHGFLGPLALGDVVEAIDRSRDFSSFVLERSNADDDRNARPVGTLDEHLRLMRAWYFAGKYLGHGAFFAGHETAVGTIQFERAAEPLVGIIL